MPIVDDNLVEGDETFRVTLSLADPPPNPVNRLNITTSRATGTITDNDEATVDLVAVRKSEKMPTI